MSYAPTAVVGIEVPMSRGNFFQNKKFKASVVYMVFNKYTTM